MRLLLIFLFLAAVVLVVFFAWGESFGSMFSQEGSVQWLSRYGSWAWLIGTLLLMSDLILPLPSTVIMSAIGYIYGTVSGGFIAAAGSFAAGALGYWLSRLIGESAAKKILGERDYSRAMRLSSSEVGVFVVVLSRWLPVFPEVISCMAGLSRMSAIRFHLGLLSGCLPMGFAYAYIGETGVDNPALAIALSAGVPPVIWLIIRAIFRNKLDIK